MPSKEEIKKSKKQPDFKSGNNLLRYSGMGFQMGAIIFLGAWVGLKLDAWLHITNKLFTAVLTILAVFVALYFSIKDFIKK